MHENGNDEGTVLPDCDEVRNKLIDESTDQHLDEITDQNLDECSDQHLNDSTDQHLNESTDQHVAQALAQVPFLSDVSVELRPCDENENRLVTEFMSAGCRCQKQCNRLFGVDYIRKFRLACLDLSSQELDMIILGQLSAFLNSSLSTAEGTHHSITLRKKKYSTFYHEGKQICLSMFCFLFTVGRKRMRNLSNHYSHNGLVPRVHGNKNLCPTIL